MNSKSHAAKNIPWRTVSPEVWARGDAHVAGLMGVTRAAAWYARGRLAAAGRGLCRLRQPMPGDLLPTDSPAGVALKYGVCRNTAAKWLASVGRPPGLRSSSPRG